MGKLIEFLRKILRSGHERSVLMKKNILGSIALKGIDGLIGFIRVPIILKFVDQSDYGIWLTLGSIIAWFSFFDIGLGNGLRNKLAEALAKNDIPLAKTYVSTTYAIIAIISCGLLLLFVCLFPWIDWNHLIFPKETPNPDLPLVVLITFFSFAIQFVLNLIGVVLRADQRPAVGQMIGVVGSIIYIIILWILSLVIEGSILWLAIMSYGSSILVLFLATLILFRSRYSKIAPSIKSVSTKDFKGLASLGIKFFIIQIAAMVMFSTDNVIIARIFNAAEVVPYNISRTYFSVATMAFGIIMNPLWSAYTDAYVKDDFSWIRRTTKRIQKLWLLLVVGVIIMFVFSDLFYRLWVGKEIFVPRILSLIMAFYVIIMSWNFPYVYFLNGTGKIKLQLVNSIVVMILNIPLSIFFAKNLGMGISGVMLATCICLFIGAIWAPIQYFKIINKTASGIWAA